MHKICKYIDCISRIRKKYAVKLEICRNLQFYMQNMQMSIAFMCTPHVADGDSPDQNGRADVQLEPDLRVCRFRVAMKDSDAVMTLRPYRTRHPGPGPGPVLLGNSTGILGARLRTPAPSGTAGASSAEPLLALGSAEMSWPGCLSPAGTAFGLG